jgi:membrane protein
MKTAWLLIRETFADWKEDKASRLAAALAYYTIFSIAPLLILVIAITSTLFGREAVSGQVEAQLQGLIGEEAAQFVQALIRDTWREGDGLAASVIGVITLLLGATGVFGQLHDALNTIWEVPPSKGRGFAGILQHRFASFTMVLGIGFLLTVSLLINAALAAAQGFVAGEHEEVAYIGQGINFVMSFGVITVLFAMIYKVLPDARIEWRDVWIGAAVTAFLFNIGKLAIGFYLGRSAVASAYGAAGALVILLVWVYYSAQILFFGAEFTQVYAHRFGSRIIPDNGSEMPSVRGERTS